MVRLKVQEDNIKLKMNAPDGATFRTNEYTPIMSGSSDYNELDNKPSINGHTLEGDQTSEDLDLFSGDYNDLTNKPTEISVANITNGSSSSKGLISGRRAKSAVDAFAPVKDVQVGGTSVVSGGVAEITIPPLVTDLGYIDPEEYEDDVYVFMNTLTENGFYKFFWDNGDDYSYFAQVQSITYGGAIYVNQHCWGLEESPITEWVRGFIVEDGEVVSEETSSYMTYESARNSFAPQNHYHFRTDSKAVSVWDYCDGSQIRMLNGSPILYTDILNNRQYVIETWQAVRQPIYTIQKVTDLNDPSCFYQRSSNYYFGTEHWGNWYKFSGEIFDPSGR